MCFVDPRPPLLPEAKPRATTAVEFCFLIDVYSSLFNGGRVLFFH